MPDLPGWLVGKGYEVLPQMGTFGKVMASGSVHWPEQVVPCVPALSDGGTPSVPGMRAN